MSVLGRSWVVVGLWVATLFMALLLPAEVAGGRDIFLNLNYLFGGLLILSFLWARFSLLGLRVTRQLRSNRAQVGKYAEETLVVENTGPYPKLWLEVRDHSDLPFHRISRVVNWLPGRHQRSWVVKTPCYRRGRFRLGPITLYSGDPFGLFLLRREMEQAGSIVVYPATAHLPAFSPSLGELSGGSMLRRRTHNVTTNVSGVRDYAPGDGFNRIHWPSTARTNRLIVKEFELDPLADIWLFMDMELRVHVGTRRSSVPEVTLPSVLHVLLESPGAIELDPTTEEYAVAITASLARHFLDRGWSLGLVTYPRDQRRQIAQADRGPRQLDRLLSTLAVVRALGNVPLAQVLEAETVYLTRNSMAIVVTPSVTQADWVPALRRLVVRGVHALAVVIDPVSFVPGSAREEDTQNTAAALLASRIPCYLVRMGDRLQDVLCEPRQDKFWQGRHFPT
jgi:uncharacterized protein (DUF58 family)